MADKANSYLEGTCIILARRKFDHIPLLFLPSCRLAVMLLTVNIHP